MRFKIVGVFGNFITAYLHGSFKIAAVVFDQCVGPGLCVNIKRKNKKKAD
jgi:hypothetical protein